MSYRPSVSDSSRATPYFYSRSHFPIKTHRSSYMDMALSATGTKKFGAFKPFWVKGLDKGVKGGKWTYGKAKPFWTKTPHKKYLSIAALIALYGKTSKRKYKIRKVCRRRSPSDKRSSHHKFSPCKRNRQYHSRTNRRNRRRRSRWM